MGNRGGQGLMGQQGSPMGVLPGGARAGVAMGGWLPQPQFMQPRPYMIPGEHHAMGPCATK